MSGFRSEARTDHGWQRFDRVAGLVSLLLVLALLILWFARNDIEKGDDTKVSSPVSALTEPGDQTTNADTGTGNKIDTTPAILPGALATAEPKIDGQSGTLAMVEPANEHDSEKDSEKSAEQTEQGTDKARSEKADKAPAKNKIDISKKEIETAAKKKADKVVKKETEPKKVEQKKAEEPVLTKEVPKKVADAGKTGDAKTDSATAATGMSLASQDPARQATFERIPKYIDKSITAAGSLTAGGQVAANSSTDAQPVPGTDAGAKSVTDVQRSASSLVKQVPKVNSVLELSSSDGRLSIDGIVSSEQVRAAILKAGLQAYGMRNLTDRLSVNEAVAPFDWADNASDLIVLIGGPESETTVRIDGQTVTLTGQVNELGDKQSRALAAQQLFGTRARVDNRLKVVPKPEPVKVAKAQQKPAVPVATPATPAKPVAPVKAKTETTKPDSQKPGSQKAATQKAATQKAATQKAATQKTAATTAGQDSSQLAEGGPGQVDTVVMGPRGMPDRFKRGDCPRVMTGVRIRFKSASVEISKDGRAYLDSLQRCFRSRSYIVRGHTDSRGAALNNLILSQERAQSVVDYLISIGVPSNRVAAKGYGEATPVDSNRSERGRARNRRIDFRFKR